MSISQDKAQKKKMLHIYFAPRAFSPRQMPSVTRSISQGQKLVSRQTLGVHEIINSTFLRIMEKNPAISTSVGSNLVWFGGSFGFLRFGRFEVRFLGPN